MAHVKALAACQLVSIRMRMPASLVLVLMVQNTASRLATPEEQWTAECSMDYIRGLVRIIAQHDCQHACAYYCI
jgi:hypothetical protein